MGVYLCSMGINVGVVQNIFYDVLFVYDDDDLTSGAVGVHYLIVSGDIFSCVVNIPRRSRQPHFSPSLLLNIIRSGNHECAGINRIYGFYDECRRRFSVKLWKAFCNTFNCLPCTAVIDDKIICMHGGLSPELSQMEQIANIARPCDVPDTGLLCDILWADPDPSITVSRIFVY